MAKLTRSLTLAVSITVSSHFVVADSIEETVVVADRVDTAVTSLAVSVNVLDRELISALALPHYLNYSSHKSVYPRLKTGVLEQ